MGPPPTGSVAVPPFSKLSLQGRATQSESALSLTCGAQLTSAASLTNLPSPVASQLQFQFQQEYVHKQPIELRVNFEGKPNNMATSFLEMENCGTAAVYYSWQVCTCMCTVDVHVHCITNVIIHVVVTKVQSSGNHPSWKYSKILL